MNRSGGRLTELRPSQCLTLTANRTLLGMGELLEAGVGPTVRPCHLESRGERGGLSSLPRFTRERIGHIMTPAGLLGAGLFPLPLQDGHECCDRPRNDGMRPGQASLNASCRPSMLVEASKPRAWLDYARVP